jgi:hypothetical protein
MPDEDHLAIHRSEFFCDLIFPRLILGAIFIWHLWAPHVVRGAQYIPQICRQFLIFLVCSFPATVDEQHVFLHGSYSFVATYSIRVIVGSAHRGLRVAGSCSGLAHAHRYAAPPDVAIAPDTLTAEQSLPRLATASLYKILDVDFREDLFQALE